MQMTPRSPRDGIYPATDDYVHAMEVGGAARFQFVSGTMGLDVRGKGPECLEDQLSLVWSNARRILGEANITIDNIVRLTSYLRDVTYAEANQNARIKAMDDRRVPGTVYKFKVAEPSLLQLAQTIQKCRIDQNLCGFKKKTRKANATGAITMDRLIAFSLKAKDLGVRLPASAMIHAPKTWNMHCFE